MQANVNTPREGDADSPLTANPASPDTCPVDSFHFEEDVDSSDRASAEVDRFGEFSQLATPDLEPLQEKASDAYFVKTDSTTMSEGVTEHVMTHEIGHV